MKQKKSYILKKDIRLAYICSWSGLAILVGSIVLLIISKVVFDYQLPVLLWVSFLFGVFLLLIGSGYYLCNKCKCPYCGFGSGGRYDSAFHKELSLKKQALICPCCKSEIRLR